MWKPLPDDTYPYEPVVSYRLFEIYWEKGRRPEPELEQEIVRFIETLLPKINKYMKFIVSEERGRSGIKVTVMIDPYPEGRSGHYRLELSYDEVAKAFALWIQPGIMVGPSVGTVSFRHQKVVI